MPEIQWGTSEEFESARRTALIFEQRREMVLLAKQHLLELGIKTTADMNSRHRSQSMDLLRRQDVEIDAMRMISGRVRQHLRR